MSSILHWHDERTDTEVCYYSDHVAAVRDERECHANEGPVTLIHDGGAA